MEIHPFCHGCKAAPSRTPVTSSSISPVRAWLTRRTQSGRILKSADPLEDRSEELSGHGDFRKLERHVLGVPGDLGTDLDEILLQRGQRPLPHALWKCQPVEEVPEVLCQGEELQTSVVCPEGLAGEPNPPDGIVAFLDPLLRRSTTVVELDHFPCLPRKIRDDEARAWKQLVGVPLTRLWRPHDVSDPMTSPDSESPRKRSWGDVRIVPLAGPTVGLSAAPTQDST